MSVHLSHVEFNPQFTDEDEAELEREEWEQQQDLKEFLEREMGDDTFEVSFASYHSQSNHSSDKLSQKTQVLAVKENHSEPYQNGTHQYDPRADPALMKGINGSSHRNYMNSNTYNGQSPTNPKYGSATTPSQDYYNMSANHYPNDDVFNNNNERTTKDFNKQYIEDSQLHVLYNARGKKIESLEIEKEEQKEKFAKEIRVLQHKLTMITSEKDGLTTSNQQQQNLIIEHKQEISMLEKELQKEQDEKSKLNKELQELNEKLFASDCALDTLQQQIKQMNQTESVSRARAQHESMLATMRQRHDEEVLTLKEKLDDLQQALAWKTEDVNRYREMLDSNSSVSEIGILRNRISQEERKNNELQIEMEKHRSKYFECEEQLKLYEGLVKMQAAQLTSTPLPSNMNNALVDKHDLDKTPCTTNIRTNEMDTIGLGPCDSSFREELVKSLSINREKRHQMNVLRDQLEYFQKQLHGRQNMHVEHRITQTDTAELGEFCEQCKKLQTILDEKVDELERVTKSSQDEIKRHENDKAELRTNMSDMVKRFDKQKLDDLQNQNKATLQLIDDVKANLLQEVQKVHETEKEQFQDEIDSLNGELLHTKEDYLKLCTEVKDLEDNLRKEFDVERKRELEDLKRTLEVEYANKISDQEVKLTDKYFDDLEKEKQKWLEDSEKGNADKIEKSLMLAKADWIESYNTKRGSNVSVGEKSEVSSLKEKCLKLEETVKELEAKCADEQQDFNVELEAAKAFWEEEQQKLFEEKLTKIELNEKEKMDEELKNAIKDCNDKWEKEIKKVQSSLNDQTSLSRKVDLDFKLKSALWERTEGELKRKIDLLQKEASKTCEKCEQAEECSDRNNTSNNSNEEQGNVSSSALCERCLEVFKELEASWLIKEEELHLLLQEAHNHIGIKLAELKSKPASAQTAETNKETGTFTDAFAEANHWKERYEESENRITDLNNNLASIKDDVVFTESSYERKLDSLQKQLAKVQEDLQDREKELTYEKENAKEANTKFSQLKTDQIEKEHINTMLKNEKTALENKFKNQHDLLQNEISTLKDTVAQLRAELENEKERYIKLKVDYDKLNETAMSENTSMVSTRYSMESEYDKKYKDLAAECNNWKSKYLDVEKENSELDRNLQLQLSNVTKTESYFKKQVETLQGEIETLNNSINQVQSELFVEKEKSTKLDLECKQMTKNYNINLENVLNVEKRKWQIESAKLQEAVLKASEIDHNNFVKEIQSQTNHINEISKIKEEHESTVRNLKQGFRDKLARITEMKKKWIREEEEKRSQIEKKIKEKYATKFSELQEQHEGILRDQQTHWIKEIHQSKKEHLTMLAGLREEVKMKDNLLLKERKSFQENEAEQKHKIRELMTGYSREVEKLKVEHLNELQSEKKRVEQYFKLFYENPSLQNSKDGSGGKKEISSKDIGVEVPEKDALEEVEPIDSHGRTRQFYLETLERIQQDVMEHVTTMRENADNEIKEAVERERKRIYHELRERNITTSSPKLDNMDDRGFGSQTFTNSMINGSCMAFKDLPHEV